MSRARDWWRMVWTLLQLCFKADPWRSTALFGCEIVSNLLLLAATAYLKVLVDGVVAHDRGRIYVAAGVMAGAAAGAAGFAAVYQRLSTVVIERTGLYVDTRLMSLATEPATIEHHERHDYVDQMTLVRTERRTMPQMMNAVVLNMRIGLGLVGAVVLLAAISPWLLLLPLFGLPGLAAGRAASGMARRAREANAERTRRRDHLFQVASSLVAGRELRVFGLVDELSRRHHEVSRAMEQETRRAALRGLAVTTVGSVVAAAGYAGAIVLVLVLAHRGDATVGSVILALSLTAMVNTQMIGVAQYGAYFQQVVSTARRMVWLTDYAAASRPAASAERPVPERLTSGIALREVSFSYPGTERAVLDGISLELPAGTVVALVGDNGSGKTTLVKLLTGLHRPTAGRIEVDGVSLDDLDLLAWRERVSGAFQDFVRFELTLGAVVGLGDLPFLDDPAAQKAALERAGAAELPGALADGLETRLGARWGGVDLSGGQWQKTAIARGVMRPLPLLRIFDERSAALDASAEHDLFTHIAEVSRSGVGYGAVTVLVSHRFTTVPAADLIVVLKDGRVAEIGDHRTLLRAGGLYAELYHLQMRAYR